MKQPKGIKETACNLLARREHSQFELRQKLKARQFDDVSIEEALSFVVEHGWQSDERFVEALVRERLDRGYGPLKILNELHAHQINEALIDAHFSFDRVFWGEQLRLVRAKRFGEGWPSEFEEKMKQMRFLENRGFDRELIRQVFK